MLHVVVQVVLSVVEIYCERVRDLLESMGGSSSTGSSSTGSSRDNLPIKQDPIRGVYVEGKWCMVHGVTAHIPLVSAVAAAVCQVQLLL